MGDEQQHEEEKTPASNFDPFKAIHDRIDQLEAKLGQIGEFVGHMVGRLEELIGRARPAIAGAAAVLEAVAPASSGAKVAEILSEAAPYVPCPDHPDAPQTDNRCNAEGCDYKAPRNT